ncbi:MAG: DNA primase [Legionellales bacterium]|nr:DNA primase [Legionellales bacterium]
MIGLIPRPFIDDLLTRTDIVEFIDSHVPLKKRGTSYTACCPFHNEKTPSFNVVAKNQFYHCFGCGASGNAISFAMNHLHLSFSDAIEALALRLGLQVPREGRAHTPTVDVSLYQFLTRVSHFYQKTLKRSGLVAISYLKQRHISGEVARLYQIGYAPVGWHILGTEFHQHQQELLATGMVIAKEDGKTYDRYRQRIMFPIHDRHGRIIGFGGRSIDDSQKPKYLNSPETSIFQKSRELYGLHQVLQHQSAPDNILVVEGYMDVIALAQHGIFNAVATLGTATSTYHIQLLSKYTKLLIFCFDGDDAGRRAAKRALENTLPYVNADLDARFVFLPESHDPDSLVREEGTTPFQKRCQNALPLSRFFIDTLTQGTDITSLAGKSQLIHNAKPYLVKMTNHPYKHLLIDELARITRIEAHRILQMVEDKKSGPPVTPQQVLTRSPIRIAIALLLQHPDIVTSCAEDVMPQLDPKKQRVLKTLIEQISIQPTINTAQLVEAWRDTPIFDAMTQLATWDHQVPEEALVKEFLDIVLFLAKQNQENTIQYLLKKAQDNHLTEAERLDLQNRLKQRHTNTS